MKYTLFKGCFIPIRLPHIEKVAQTVLPELGIKLNEISEFTCCPEPIGVNLVHRLTGITVSALNLSIAEEAGHDIITICNGCTYTLRQANHALKQDPELREQVNEILAATDHQYKGSINVKHFAQVFTEDLGLEKIRSRVEIPLTGLRIASHTGCHITSPPEIMNYDDIHNPVKLDQMIEALGAESLDYLYKAQCCGWTLSNFGDRNAAYKLLGDKFYSMDQAGADCLAVICPQCLAQLDTGQVMASRALKLDFKIPALFYLQYLALTMGYSLEDIGYKRHRTKSKKFEKKLGGILGW